MNDIVVKDNFFDLSLIKQVFDQCQSLTCGKDFVDQHGVFKGLLVAYQAQLLNLDIKGLDQLLDRMQELFEDRVKIVAVTYIRLYLPWDIHCDLTYNDSQDPFYNVLIPLCDAESSTVIFDQCSPGYNNFSEYKKTHSQVPMPIDQETWNQNLSMCWTEDRLWLTIKQILPRQCAGQVVAFKRNLFHSSDSFHLRQKDPKHFLQIMTDRYHEQNTN